MLYDIKLVKVDYAFETPAAGARQILHAQCRSTIPGRQRLIAGSVSISIPKPCHAPETTERTFFGNQVDAKWRLQRSRTATS
jgi:hypothetical protein